MQMEFANSTLRNNSSFTVSNTHQGALPGANLDHANISRPVIPTNRRRQPTIERGMFSQELKSLDSFDVKEVIDTIAPKPVAKAAPEVGRPKQTNEKRPGISMRVFRSHTTKDTAKPFTAASNAAAKPSTAVSKPDAATVVVEPKASSAVKKPLFSPLARTTAKDNNKPAGRSFFGKDHHHHHHNENSKQNKVPGMGDVTAPRVRYVDFENSQPIKASSYKTLNYEAKAKVSEQYHDHLNAQKYNRAVEKPSFTVEEPKVAAVVTEPAKTLVEKPHQPVEELKVESFSKQIKENPFVISDEAKSVPSQTSGSMNIEKSSVFMDVAANKVMKPTNSETPKLSIVSKKNVPVDLDAANKMTNIGSETPKVSSMSRKNFSSVSSKMKNAVVAREKRSESWNVANQSEKKTTSRERRAASLISEKSSSSSPFRGQRKQAIIPNVNSASTFVDVTKGVIEAAKAPVVTKSQSNVASFISAASAPAVAIEAKPSSSSVAKGQNHLSSFIANHSGSRKGSIAKVPSNFASVTKEKVTGEAKAPVTKSPSNLSSFISATITAKEPVNEEKVKASGNRSSLTLFIATTKEASAVDLKPFSSVVVNKSQNRLSLFLEATKDANASSETKPSNVVKSNNIMSSVASTKTTGGNASSSTTEPPKNKLASFLATTSTTKMINQSEQVPLTRGGSDKSAISTTIATARPKSLAAFIAMTEEKATDSKPSIVTTSKNKLASFITTTTTTTNPMTEKSNNLASFVAATSIQEKPQQVFTNCRVVSLAIPTTRNTEPSSSSTNKLAAFLESSKQKSSPLVAEATSSTSSFVVVASPRITNNNLDEAAPDAVATKPFQFNEEESEDDDDDDGDFFLSVKARAQMKEKEILLASKSAEDGEIMKKSTLLSMEDSVSTRSSFTTIVSNAEQWKKIPYYDVSSPPSTPKIAAKISDEVLNTPSSQREIAKKPTPTEEIAVKFPQEVFRKTMPLSPSSSSSDSSKSEIVKKMTPISEVSMTPTITKKATPVNEVSMAPKITKKATPVDEVTSPKPPTWAEKIPKTSSPVELPSNTATYKLPEKKITPPVVDGRRSYNNAWNINVPPPPSAFSPVSPVGYRQAATNPNRAVNLAIHSPRASQQTPTPLDLNKKEDCKVKEPKRAPTTLTKTKSTRSLFNGPVKRVILSRSNSSPSIRNQAPKPNESSPKVRARKATDKQSQKGSGLKEIVKNELEQKDASVKSKSVSLERSHKRPSLTGFSLKMSQQQYEKSVSEKRSPTDKTEADTSVAAAKKTFESGQTKTTKKTMVRSLSLKGFSLKDSRAQYHAAARSAQEKINE